MILVPPVVAVLTFADGLAVPDVVIGLESPVVLLPFEVCWEKPLLEQKSIIKRGKVVTAFSQELFIT